MDEAEKKELLSVIDSGWFTEAEKTKKFEKMFADFTGSKYACAVTSGTAGLYLGLNALGISSHDEVLLPDLTFVASPNSIKANNAKPVLIDIDSKSLNLDCEKISKKITKKTKAIMTVNFNGRTTNLKLLKEIAQKNNLNIVEDAAHSLGSYYGGKHQGNFSDIGVFSFSTPKIITTGQGGMIVTNDKHLYEKCMQLKDFGRKIGAKKKMLSAFEHETVGYNFKFTEFQAAIGIAQMKKLPNRMKIKKNMFKLYHELLSKISDIEFIETDLNKITPWMVDVIIKNKKKRLELINFLDKQGVQTRIFYPPIHRLSPYKKSDKTFPLTSLLSDQGLWLPSSVNLTNEQIIFITKKIKQFFK
ncbi:DegT/DnrJ/EryC1/StrS family aminotransferase [Candidatus Nitrosopelagicus sp.]|nr:DegT/DnrJ/EryC1/StrS family aminotransferase [Candidatus Nitrosopelagicus sp.]